MTDEQAREAIADPTFQQELERIINRFSKENDSNTPDFILVQYLLGCLAAWNEGIVARERWYGRQPEIAPPQLFGCK